VPLVDEERFVARYNQTANLTQCIREFSITKRRGRTILEKHGVQIQRKQRAETDKEAILRAFARLGSVTAVAVLQEISEPDVRAILDDHSVAHNTRPKPCIPRYQHDEAR
jgi:hypothetical protein